MIRFIRFTVLLCVAGFLTLSVTAQTTPKAKKKSAATKAAPAVTKAPTSTEQAPPPGEEELKLTDFRDSLSYALGVNVIGTIQAQQLDINPMILMRSLEDAFTGQKPAMTEADMMSVFKKFEQIKQASKPKEDKSFMDETKAKGKAFLAENAKKPGVMTTASGLQYRIVTQGTGVKPTSSSDRVKVHYKGTFVDGKEFDSSYKTGEPAVFGLNGVIKGWTEGLQLMSVGSKFEFFIPTELAWGDRGSGTTIPPGAAVLFEVELLDVNPAPAK